MVVSTFETDRNYVIMLVCIYLRIVPWIVVGESFPLNVKGDCH